MTVGSSTHDQAVSEINQEIAALFEKKYASWLGQRFFEVSFKTEASTVLVSVTLRNSDKSFVYPIEGRILHVDQDLKPDEARTLVLDYIDAYLEEYLTGGEETYLPIDWANYDCEGIELQLRGQILNIKLEELADQFISGQGKKH